MGNIFKLMALTGIKPVTLLHHELDQALIEIDYKMHLFTKLLTIFLKLTSYNFNSTYYSFNLIVRKIKMFFITIKIYFINRFTIFYN